MLALFLGIPSVVYFESPPPHRPYPCLPLQLREDREGPCLQPAASRPPVAPILTRAAWAVDVTLAEPHLGDCSVAAGLANPRWMPASGTGSTGSASQMPAKHPKMLS